ncbi:MAG: methyl-accepting chemotaxis protein [Cyanobacteria bacterium J06560_2]
MSKSIFGKTANFRIQRQLLALLLLSTALPLAIVGGYGVSAFTRVTSRALIEDFEEEAVSQADIVESFLGSVREDVEFIADSYLLQGLLDAEENGGISDSLSTDTWKKQLTGDMLALIRTHPEYRQLTYIDQSGQPIFRVRYDPVDDDSVEVVSESVLLSEEKASHIEDILALESGEIYVTQPGGEREEGAEELGDATHYAAPVFNSAGSRRGAVIVDVATVKFAQLIEAFEESEVDEGEEEVHFLMDAQGTYIQAPEDDDDDEGEEVEGEEIEGEASEEALESGGDARDDFPDQVIDEILAGEQGVVDAGGELIAYAEIDPNPEQEGEHFYVVESLPKRSVYGPINDFRNVALLVSLLAIAIALPIGFLRGRQLIGLIEQLIGGISTSSQQIFSTVSEQERIASQQAASVSETSTTMEELEASSRQSSEQAMAAVAAAKTARDRAEVGTQAVNDTLAGMFTLEQKVDAIAQQIVNLSGQAGEIGSISQMVSDFASQTNMLALNSSVEAVRAGEHGRGFAVVANEIRKLSEQSQQSADKINVLVAGIQKLINKTVMVTEEGTKTAKSGVKIAKLTEQAFVDIQKSVDAVVMNNQQVSLTQKQQVDAIRQVVTAMENIDRSSKESATGLSQTRSGTEQLNETAQSLRKLM